jgi:hypothetical protein
MLRLKPSPAALRLCVACALLLSEAGAARVAAQG